MKFQETIKIIERELKQIYDNSNGFIYQECDPEGPSHASESYKRYKNLENELKQLKKLK